MREMRKMDGRKCTWLLSVHRAFPGNNRIQIVLCALDGDDSRSVCGCVVQIGDEAWDWAQPAIEQSNSRDARKRMQALGRDKNNEKLFSMQRNHWCEGQSLPVMRTLR